MKLYYSPGSCALSPHIVMLELGMPVELAKVDLKKKTVEDGGDYTKVNGKGSVPALTLDDGKILTEGPAIVQWLADQKPDAGLAPPNGSFERTRLHEWLNFISTDVHKSFSPLFNKSLPKEARDFFVELITKKIGWVATQLEGRTFLMGDRFTVADAYLYTVLRWAKDNDLDLARWPTVKQWSERVAARPKVQAALAAQGLKA